MLAHAATLVRAGRAARLRHLLARARGRRAADRPPSSRRIPNFARQPIAAAEIGAEPEWITPTGDLRTLPFHGPQSPPELAGMDGFYAARLRRLS